MNRFYKGFIGLAGGLSLFYNVATTDVKAEDNGGHFPNGVDVVSYADEDSGTLNDEAKYTIDEQIKRNGFMGFVTGLFTWPLRIVPSTLYGLTNQIPESKNPIEYAGKTVVNAAKGAWENKLETIVTAAVPVVVNNVKPSGGNGPIQGGD